MSGFQWTAMGGLGWLFTGISTKEWNRQQLVGRSSVGGNGGRYWPELEYGTEATENRERLRAVLLDQQFVVGRNARHCKALTSQNEAAYRLDPKEILVRTIAQTRSTNVP